MTDQIAISIVIPIYNREDLITQCLLSVLNQTFHDYEIIAIDDGSTDSSYTTVEAISNPKIKLLQNSKNIGLTKTRNRGIRESRGNFIVFTDSDCVVKPDWLQRLIKPFKQDQDIMIVGGQILDPPAKNYWEKVNNGRCFLSNQSEFVPRIIGCNMAYRRSFFNHHMFDDKLYSAADELDLCLYCQEDNSKIYYAHDAKVIHYHRSNLRSSFLQRFHFGYQNAYIHLKHSTSPIKIPNAVWLIFLFALIAVWQWDYLNNNRVLLFLLLSPIIPIVFWVIVKNKNKSIMENLICFPGYTILSFAMILGKVSYLTHKFIFKRKLRIS